MTMRSPIVAMLWEHWRLTRVEAVQRLALGIVAGSAALVLFDDGASVAFWILLLVHAFFFFSIAKLNGGRFMDGYKPGFPLYLLYTRPVRTVAVAGVAMAYDAVCCATLYAVSAALLGFAFGQPLPLLSVTACLATYHLASMCVQWSTQSRVVQWIGAIAIGWPTFFLIKNRVASSVQLEFTPAEYALMVVIGLVSVGLTVLGVTRQRHGDVVATAPRTAASGEYADWAFTLFRFPCPTSSAIKAQVWFELKSSGLSVLAIGLALAMLNALLFAISIPLPSVRPFAMLGALISVPAVLIAGGNAFGIRRRQGRTYLSAFEATQAYSTAQAAALKVLVRTACVLTALIAIAVSVWTSRSFASGWPAEGKEAALELLRSGNASWELAGYAYGAHAVVMSITVGVVVASLAALGALRARYPRGLLAAGSLLLLYGIAVVLVARFAQGGIRSDLLLDAILVATEWIATAVLVIATAYLSWRALAERLLSLRQTCGIVLVSAAFGTAWVIVLRAADVQFAGMHTMNAVWMLSPVLLPPMAGLLATWSLNRIRHL